MPGEQVEQQEPQVERQPGDGQEGRRAEGAETTLDVSDITGEPMAFVGKKVTIEGEVDEIYGQRGFKLNDEAPLQGGIDDDLVVLGGQNVQWQADQDWGNTRVRVQGTIEQMNKPSEIEQNLGWQFDNTLNEALQEEKAVLIADSVQRIEE